MSDEAVHTAGEQCTAQTRGALSAPAPIPVGEPPSPRSSRWRRIVAAVVALAVVTGCAVGIRAAVRLLGDAFGAAEDDLLEPEDWGFAGSGGVNVAQWSDDGRYLVVQRFTADGRPIVAAVDAENGSGRVIEGFRALFAEPYAPVVWLERVGASGMPADDGLGDTFDHKSDDLLVWRLDGIASPQLPESLRWAPIPGPGGISAHVAVDPSLGCGPAGIAFAPADGTPPVEPAYVRLVPQGTFVPVGWSPSGRYFAVESLLPDDPLDISALPADERPVRCLYVIDATSGSVVATQQVPTLGPAPAALWERDEDALVWLVPDEMRRSDGVVTACFDVATLRVSEEGPPRHSEAAAHVAAEGVGGTGPFLWLPCGATGEGAMFFVGASVHRVSEHGAHSIASLDLQDGAPAWHPDVGLAWATTEYDDGGTLRLAVHVADEHGTEDRVLWRGAEERPSGAFGF